MTASTRFRNLSRTRAVLLTTCETVPIETCARPAICFIVTGLVIKSESALFRLLGPCGYLAGIPPLHILFEGAKELVAAAAAQFADDVAHDFLRVAKEHESVVEVVERVVDASKTGGHAAFDDHYGARFVDVDDGHAINGAAFIAARGRIGY